MLGGVDPGGAPPGMGAGGPGGGAGAQGPGAGAAGGAGGHKDRDELKTQFVTREGQYRLMTLSEYSRPNRVGYGMGVGVGVGGGGVGSVSGGVGGGGGPGSGSGVGGAGSGSSSGQNQPVRVSFAPGQPAVHGAASGVASSATGMQHPLSNGAAQSSSGDAAAAVSQGWIQGEKIAFNYGREVYVYPYRGVKKAADLTKPIDKRCYKGTFPTCHDFGKAISNSSSGSSNEASSHVLPLLLGFSQGQIQLLDPIGKELSKLYNEERLIEKSKVTCIRWMPGSPNYFVVSHASGNLYIYNQELICTSNAPTYQLFKPGDGFSVYTCKTKTSRNPLYKWSIGKGSINEFAFSPCGHFLATVSQDGCLRIFNVDTMELTRIARSYFGGLLCVCWSPDGKYLVVGGEDDLVTVYSFHEQRVVVRGQGHKSWVSVVSFDTYNVSYGEVPDGLDFSASDEEYSSSSPAPPSGSHAHHTSATPPPGALNGSHYVGVSSKGYHPQSATTSPSTSSSQGVDPGHVTCYRFGSVGEDTMLCLWDITEETLKKASAQSQTLLTSPSSSVASGGALGASAAATAMASTSNSSSLDNQSRLSTGSSGKDSGHATLDTSTSTIASTSSSYSVSLTQRLASLHFNSHKDKEHKRGSSSSSSSSGSKAPEGASSKAHGSGAVSGGNNDLGVFPEIVPLGTPQCPKIHDVPIIEPLVMKKIAHERLTDLIFKEECLVTACQDGYICTWARPGRVSGSYSMNMLCPGSPPQGGSPGNPVGDPSGGGHPTSGGTGTVV